MTKDTIVTQLHTIIGEEKISKAEAGRVWNALLEVLAEEVKNGGEVKFGSLFKVYKRDRAERNVRNPRTGEKFVRPARSELACKVMRAGKQLFLDTKVVVTAE